MMTRRGTGEGAGRRRGEVIGTPRVTCTARGLVRQATGLGCTGLSGYAVRDPHVDAVDERERRKEQGYRIVDDRV